VLALVYGWFTEGLDTADLQDAKNLLEELANCFPIVHTVTAAAKTTMAGDFVIDLFKCI
jgi:hypothetical protein